MQLLESASRRSDFADWRRQLARALVLATGTLLAACSSAASTHLFDSVGEQRAAPPVQTQIRADGVVRESVASLTQSAHQGSRSYRIGPDDILEVTVFKVPELTKNVQVSETGLINLPLIGEHVAANKTPQDVERELTQRLGESYLRNPQVTVLVKEFNSQRVTVEGEVKKPGVFPIRGRTTLIQIVAMAGGFDTVADSSEVVVFRQAQGGRSAARFDFEEIRAGRMPDPDLVAGDIVVVNSSAMKSAFQNVLKVLPLAGVFVGLL